MLFFTGKNKQEEVREFGCGLESLEEELDFLNTMIADGYTLVSAHLIDNDGRIDLPVEVFDGLPLSASMQRLRDEWESILSQSTPERLLHKQIMTDLVNWRIRQHHTVLANHERMISHLVRWQQRTKSSPRNYKILHQYERMTSDHLRYIDKGQMQLVRLERRLRELMAQ